LKGNKNPEEEEADALQEKPLQPNKSNYTLVEMSLPEWFCPVVCSGLDLSELMPPRPSNNNFVPVVKASKKSFIQIQVTPKSLNPNAINLNSFEENEVLNLDRDLTVDPQDDE